MTSTELPWRVWGGRTLRPYSFAVSVATAVLTYAVLAGVAVGDLLDGLPGLIVGVAGVGSVLALWGGWWLRSNTWMRWGLFWTTGVWVAAAAVLALDAGHSTMVSAALAACWAVASGGAWLLEAGAPRMEPHV